MKLKAIAVLLLVAGSLTFLLSACDSEPDATSSRQAKETTVAMPPAAHGADDGHGHGQQLRFATPEGWQADPTPRQMREATFLIGTGEKSAELVVSKLAGKFGDFGANINRWRGQIGLEPLSDPASVQPRIIKTPVGDAKLVKLEGADKVSIISMVQQGEQTWFFRLTGEKSTVVANEFKLEQLLASLSSVSQ